MSFDQDSFALPKYASQWRYRLKTARETIENNPVSLTVEGKLTRMVGMTLEAVGCQSPIGGRCLVDRNP